MTKHFLLLFLFLKTVGFAQNLYFPPLTGNSWDTLSPTSLGWCNDKIDSLLNYLEQRNTKAFLVLKDGKIVIEKYFGTFTQDSIWYWASAGKTLTAFTVGIAQQEGFLSINDTTSNYLGTGWTDCTITQEEKITIRHQLTMTSGLDDGVNDPHCTIDTCLKYKADAGTRWAYHNAPYTLLDNVIQSATGQNLNTYFTYKVKIPTGITGTFFYTGFNNVFYSKARSMARFGLLILNKGNWNGNQIMTDTAYFNQMVNTSQTLNESYGYLWWLNGKNSFMIPNTQFVFPSQLFPSAPSDMISALGKDGQIINVVPSENLVVVRMGNAPLISQAVTITFNDTIWQKINELTCNSTLIETNSKNSFFNFYPNPTYDKLIIELPKWNEYQFIELEIFDVSGKMVYNQKIENINSPIEINVTTLNQGIYFLTFKNNQIPILKEKFVINKTF